MFFIFFYSINMDKEEKLHKKLDCPMLSLKSYHISFNIVGRDLFIDFLKAYCILVVVFCHGFPYLDEIGYPVWGGIQIPLFIIIQVFHCYKRKAKPINWNIMIRRIILPFIIVEMVIALLLLCKHENSPSNLLLSGLVGGGFGPGSYYPWIYVQMAVLIPSLRFLCDKFGKYESLFVFLIIAESLEIVFSLINIPNSIYRLLSFRYMFLLWIGWVWAKEGISLDKKNILVSLLSLFAIVYLNYVGGIKEPLLFDTDWVSHRWPCYFWVGFMFTGILYAVYKVMSNNKHITKAIGALSSSSYEIFLIQMAYYAVVRITDFSFAGNEYIQFTLW